MLATRCRGGVAAVVIASSARASTGAMRSIMRVSAGVAAGVIGLVSAPTVQKPPMSMRTGITW